MEREMLERLSKRRSAKPDMLREPGPAPDQLRQILTIAARVPDHKKQVPWRFIVFEGDARKEMGEIFAQTAHLEGDEALSDIRLETERARFLRAPLVIAVISSPSDNRAVPEWEQILSAGASALNLCHAANSMGYATSWLTEWVAHSPKVSEVLGLTPRERVAGFVYVGTIDQPLSERARPQLDDIVTYWGK